MHLRLERDGRVRFRRRIAFFSFLSDVSILRYSMLFTITIIQLYDIHLVLLFSFGIHVDI